MRDCSQNVRFSGTGPLKDLLQLHLTQAARHAQWWGCKTGHWSAKGMGGRGMALSTLRLRWTDAALAVALHAITGLKTASRPGGDAYGEAGMRGTDW
jgi:hypothetical protein